METFDTAPCADWDTVVHPAPELPVGAPAVPTVLWEWSPLEDPMLSGLSPGVGGYELRLFTISATGDIWLRGPTETDVTALGRDGRAIFHARLDDPLEHRISLGAPVAAPDGTVFLGASGASRFVVQYATSGPLGRLDMGPGTFGATIGIGPRGRVYMGDEYCRLRRVRAFHLEQRLADGTIVSQGLGGWATADGAIVSNATDLASRPVLETDGTLGWRFSVLPSEVAPGFVIVGSGTAAGRDLITTGVRTGSRFTSRLIAGEETLYRETGSAGGGVWPVEDATGAIWRFDTVAGTMSRVGHWAERPAPCVPQSGFANLIFAEDGTVVCVNLGTGRMMALSPTDGSVLWDLPADPTDPAAGFFALVGPDLDGRIYAAMQRPADPLRVPHLVAVQTNLRPPGDGFCYVDAGCNRHRNFWAHDYRPTP